MLAGTIPYPGHIVQPFFSQNVPLEFLLAEQNALSHSTSRAIFQSHYQSSSQSAPNFPRIIPPEYIPFLRGYRNGHPS